MSGAADNATVAAAMAIGSRRAMVSHCALCMTPHRDGGHGTGVWVDDNLTRKIIYFFCERCSKRYEKAGRKARRHHLERVEKNLAEMGVLDGLKREGLRA
jgi:hypothetical protein